MSPDDHSPDLREYLSVLRARKVGVAFVALLLVGASLFFTLRQLPVYEGRAKVLLRSVQPATNSLAPAQPPNLETERELILSEVVAERVQESHDVTLTVEGLLENALVEVVTDTEILVVKYRSTEPGEAAALANGFADEYVQLREQELRTRFEAAAAAVRSRIQGTEDRLSTLESRIEESATPEARSKLRGQRDALVAQLGVLQQRLLEVQANASVNQDTAEVIQRASIPDVAISPNPLRNGILAAVAGLALGVGFAFLRERLDDRMKSRAELERQLGAPVVAAVPRIAGWRKKDEAVLVVRSDPKSPVSEAYRTLGTNVQYMASVRPLKVLMIASSLGGDGKTTTAANLAVVLAQAGRRVILVSADLRRPRLHTFFGLVNDVGLSDILSQAIPVSRVAKDPGVPNLRVVLSGAVPPDPAALLGSDAAAEFIDSIKEVCDYVLIDTPPVLAVADASTLGHVVDGTLFVLDAARSSRSATVAARQQLETAGANIVGAVFNNFDPGSATYSTYYRHEGYYEPNGWAASNGNGSGRGKRRENRRHARA